MKQSDNFTKNIRIFDFTNYTQNYETRITTCRTLTLFIRLRVLHRIMHIPLKKRTITKEYFHKCRLRYIFATVGLTVTYIAI